MPPPERLPRYRRFLITGGLVGLAASVVLLIAFGPAEGGRDRTELTILLTAFLVGTGVLIAGVLAVVSESRNRTRRLADDDAGAGTPSP